MPAERMWALENHTPYGAERNWIRDKDGHHLWIVAVKATFNVAPNGQLTLADEQPPPALAPEYEGEPGASSLLFDSDLLYTKPCTDVIAVAQAYAPGGQPRETIMVSLRVGPIQKRLLVFGDRSFMPVIHGLAPGSAKPFVSRPIRYEWAFGGMDLQDPQPSKHRIDDRNPIGKGFAVDAQRLLGQPVYAIEYPNTDPSRAGPAGFGPIDPAWSPRRQRAGTYDAIWEKTKKPLLPNDYDELYASAAPDDQRVVPYLQGGERVELLGLTPEGALTFDLPKIYLAYSTRFGEVRREHRGRLATVLLEPDKRQVALVWQTALPVAPREGDYLDATRIVEKRYV